MHRLLPPVVAAALLASTVPALARRGPGPADLPALLQRVGVRVEQDHAQARTLLSTETVELQALAGDRTPVGRSRRIVDELRVEWTPAAVDEAARAQVRRRILTINGRPPDADRDNPDDACMDPRQVSPEPLEFLLPSRRGDYAFSWAGTDRINGRGAAKIDYRPTRAKPASVVWKGDCVSVDVPAQERGRVWVDLDTGDVLRVDQRLHGRFEVQVPRAQQHADSPTWMEIERADTSIRYAPVTFHDPEETLMLPASIESLQVVRNASVPRLRTRQTFRDYRRFLTSGKLVPPAVPR